jgi:N-acetyl-anhydromuramyl-L-alanine amidase AmpD
VSIPHPHIDCNYQCETHGRHHPVRIILHDTESHDHAGVQDIRGIEAFWKRQGAGYGSHYIIDGDGNIGAGPHPTLITWHTGGANTNSIGIELIGFARFSRVQWLRRRRQLAALARLLAYLSDRYDIPLVRSIEGVCLHRDFPKSGHTDPGPGFPHKRVVWMARRIQRKHRVR